MTQLFLYNTESRQKEPIFSRSNQKIRMYTCGPTIYDFAHIGNFRTYVFEDILRRTLQFFGFHIEQVMNLTDVEDKTIRGAVAKNIPLKEYTEPYRLAFFEDLKALSIQPAEHYPAATDYIPEMIRLIQCLLERGYAYKSPNGSVYYAIQQFSSYGRLSHLDLSDLKVNARGENDEYDKESAADFVLWKAYDPKRDGPTFWDSPFGKGRPGWHIECSAMAMKLLGETIDIHCGGVDNLFPHHENEIAQSEGCTGHRFAHHWVHVEHLLVDHKKMSKSLGNFYTLRDLFQRGYSGAEVRYLLLSAHYRTQLNFTFSGLDAARASLQRIGDLLMRLQTIQKPILRETEKLEIDQGGSPDFLAGERGHCQRQDSKRGQKIWDKADAGQNQFFNHEQYKTTDHAKAHLERASLRFRAALADDINISAALAALFDLVRELNALCDQQKLGANEAHNALRLFEMWNQVLAVLPFQAESTPPHLQQLLEQREQARKSKNFSLSDQLRDQILAAGYLIEDTPQGARLKRK